MAQVIKYLSGSPLIGSPIVYTVQASVVTGTVSFHRVKLEITAGLQDGEKVAIVDSSPVDSGENVQFDISSVLRSVAQGYEYTSTPPDNYPYIEFSLRAWDEYMQNGELHEDIGIVTNDGGRALMGGYSDLDRLIAADDDGGNKTTSVFTRKPTSMPEVVCDGEIYIRPANLEATIGNITAGPQSVAHDIAIDSDNPEGLRTVGGTQIYVVPKQNDRYQFRFINQFGVMESIGVTSLRETSMAVTKNDYTITRQELFSQFSRYFITKQNDAETWKLSSGPLDLMWQQWFLHEFLMTTNAWIKIGSLWISCVINPDDTVSAVNRHDHSLLEVQFGVKLDINGSPFLSV